MANYKRKAPRKIQFDFLDAPVFLRSLTPQESWDIDNRCAKDPETGRLANAAEYMAMIASASVVDEGGRPVFTEDTIRGIDDDDLAVMLDAINDARGGGTPEKGEKKVKRFSYPTGSASPSGSPS